MEHISTLDVDHLVVSGDIAANAEKRDLQLARAILKSSGWLDSKSLSLVIGNHDIFGGVHHAEDIFTFPKHCKHTNYKAKVSEFYDYFHEAFDKCLFESPSSIFPYGKVIGDVVLVGINSIAEYSKLGNPIGSNGEVSDEDFKRTQKLLASDLLSRKRKIVLIHHHFYKQSGADMGAVQSVWNAIEGQTMKLRGKKRLLKLFGESQVELVLHGHLHENREYARRNVRFLNGGGSVITNNDESRLNLVTVMGGTVQVERVIVAAGSKMVARSLPESGLVTHAAA